MFVHIIITSMCTVADLHSIHRWVYGCTSVGVRLCIGGCTLVHRWVYGHKKTEKHLVMLLRIWCVKGIS